MEGGGRGKDSGGWREGGHGIWWGSGVAGAIHCASSPASLLYELRTLLYELPTLLYELPTLLYELLTLVYSYELRTGGCRQVRLRDGVVVLLHSIYCYDAGRYDSEKAMWYLASDAEVKQRLESLWGQRGLASGIGYPTEDVRRIP